MIKIIISESKKVKPKKNLRFVLRESLLNEITMEQALVAVNSKATKKIIFNYLQPILDKEEQKRKLNNQYTFDDYRESMFKTCVSILSDNIKKHIPEDIEENDKALCVIWLKNIFLSSDKNFYDYVFKEEFYEIIPLYLERFFQWKQFINPEFKDLNKIKTVTDLENIIKDAMPRYHDHQAKKLNLDAEKGTEVIYEDDKWKIFIPHNKGAACELGKGTDWCTAAPGLEYYAQYHKPDDPLFIIYRKPMSSMEKEITSDNPEMRGAFDKYQFHYGSSQFMDSSDQQISTQSGGIDILKEVHKILSNTVGEKYSFLKNAFIETDRGLSKKVIETDGDVDSSITYVDLATKQRYGGHLPAIKITNYDEGTRYQLSWFDLVEVENTHDDFKSYKGTESKTDGPCVLVIFKTPDDISLNVCKWYIDGKYVAALNSDSGLNVVNKHMWAFENGSLMEHYEENIKGKESEFAESILQQYVGDDK